MKKQGGGVVGKLLTAVLLIAAAAFLGLLYYTDVIPRLYMILVAAGLLLLVVIVGILTWNYRKKVRFLFGVILWIILLGALLLGCLYVYRTKLTLSEVTNVNTEISQVGVYVRADDAAAGLSDTAGYTYGVLESLDQENTRAALQMVNEELGTQIQTREYAGLGDLVDGLTKGETGAILLNAAYIDILRDMDDYLNIDTMITQVDVKNVESDLVLASSVPEPAKEEAAQSEEKTEEEPETVNAVAVEKPSQDHVYTVFISGIDNRGGIVARSRSDVNIILTANLDTKQLLLVSTPRDYFVPLSISNGVPDKLTHAGIYGISVCMDTMEMLYDIELDYYVRMNFGGFVNIIDALGGITVVSDYDFNSANVVGYHFNKGENYLNGDQALVFARERYAFSEGDRQRGRNQMAVIRGVLEKLASMDLLANYSTILASLQGSFETNIGYEEIARILQQELQDVSAWNVVSYSVDGTGDTQKPYSMGQKAYVMVPDMSTVEHAKELMAKVRNGETISAQ
ncbi:MAG: LCP family protein [Blautia sp.]|nr:LCP family protein [Blautia sp.]